MSKGNKKYSLTAALINVFDITPRLALWVLELAVTILAVCLVIVSFRSLASGAYDSLFVELLLVTLCQFISWLTAASEDDDDN